MKPVVRCLFVVAGMLTAGTAFAQDFKSQATATAAQWDAAFNAGDVTKLSKAYTKDAVILPAGGEQVTGPDGAEKLFGGFIKGDPAKLEGATSYLAFVAPGMLAAQAMTTVFGEVTYPVMGMIKWQRTFYGMIAERQLRMQAPTDSAVLWALTVARLEAGAGLGEALADVVHRVAAGTGGGRLNLLLTDGATIAATAFGASLCARRLPGGVVVASEPYDDSPGWVDVPDSSLVTARPGDLDVVPL